MPELPEVETVRRQLVEAIAGRRVARLEAPGKRVARRGSLAVGAVIGLPVTDVRRIGKFLILALGDEYGLGIHLGMSGRLLLSGAGSQLERYTTFRLLFDNKSSVSLIDPRTFGEAWVSKLRAEPPYLDEIVGIGADLLDREEAVVAALESAAFSRRSIKSVLLDQRVLAGLGNMYADEVLFRAGIHPETAAAAILAERAGEIVRESRVVVEQAIEAGGTTFRDRGYRDLRGDLGRNFRQLFVYQRDGLRCYLCGSRICRTRFQGRHSHWCPTCQGGGEWN